MNPVHAAENWRQRLVAEHASAGQWREQWGFLEHTKPGGPHVDAQLPNRHLTRMIAEQGILYPYLLKTHREQRDGSVPTTSRFVVGGTARPPPKGATFNTNSNAFTHALQQQHLQQQQELQHRHQLQQPQQGQHYPHAPLQPRAPSRRRQLGDPVPSAAQTARTHRSNRHQTHAQHQYQQNGSAPLYVPHPPSHSPITSNGPLPPLHLEPLTNAPAAPTSPSPSNGAPKQRPITPVLHLDLDTARTLRAGFQQDIGGCVQTNGVDPHEKYRHPLTTSHTVGWNIANTTLEFFGVAQHATKPLTTRKLYGWD